MAEKRYRSPQGIGRQSSSRNEKRNEMAAESDFSMYSSSSSSSTYLDISREYPIPPKKGRIRTFFTAPSERRRLRRNRSRRILSLSNSSTSSVNTDLAYGTGFLRVKKNRVRKSRSRRDREKRRSSNPDAAIAALGVGLAAAARRQNVEDSRSSRRTEIFNNTERRSRNSHEVGSEIHSSRNVQGHDQIIVEEEDWESASEDESEASSSVDSSLAFGNDYIPPRARSNVVDPRLFGPANSLRGYVTEPVGFEDVDANTVGVLSPSQLYSERYEDRRYDERRSAGRDYDSNSVISRQPLQTVFPVPTSDPTRFEVSRGSAISAEEPLVVRPGPVPLQQPQPRTPVSQSIYDQASEVNVPSDRRSSSYGKSIAGAALAGMAGAAIGSMIAKDRSDDRRSGSESDRENRRKSKGKDKDRTERRSKRSDRDETRSEKSSKRDSRDSKKDHEEKHRDKPVESPSDDKREKRRDKRRDSEREEGPDERRARRREERRAERSRIGEYDMSGAVESSVAREPIDPFQFQVAEDAFPTPDISKQMELAGSRRGRDPAPTVYTVEREPDFSRMRDQVYDVPYDVEPIRRDEHSADAAVSTAFAAQVAAVAAAGGFRSTRSERRRGERRGSRTYYERRGESPTAEEEQDRMIQEEADRAYREGVIARKVASRVIRERSPSPDAVDKYRKSSQDDAEEVRILTPPGMEGKKAPGPYDAPNADFELDRIMDPTEFKSFSVPQITMDSPVYQSPIRADYDSSRFDTIANRRPLLTLVRPTPTPSPSPFQKSTTPERADSPPPQEKRRKRRSRTQSVDDFVIDSKGNVKEIPNPTASTVSKAVTWGPNETKHYDVESVGSSRKESISSLPEESPKPVSSEARKKSSGWGVVAGAIMGAAAGMAGSEISSSSKSQQSKGKDRGYRSIAAQPDESERWGQQSPPATGPKPTDKSMPGSFADDIEFTATLAAGLQDTGFDPNIVINDPKYRTRTSPPGSDEDLGSPYQKPFAETISDLGDVPRSISHEDKDRRGRSDQFQGAQAENSPLYSEEAPSKLSKKEQKRRDKQSRQQSIDRIDDRGVEELPVLKSFVQEPESYAEPATLSKKEQKKRDKAAQRQDSGPIDQASPVQEVLPTMEAFAEPESYSEPTKKSKSRKSKRSSLINDNDVETSRSDGDRKVSVPVDAFNDIINAQAGTPTTTTTTNEWDSPVEERKRKSKKGSKRSDSPSQEISSNVGRYNDPAAFPLPMSTISDPEPADYPLPPSTASEVSRAGYVDERAQKKSFRDSGIFDPSDREIRSIASTGADNEESRKSKKKSRSRREDDDDTKSVASAPAYDEYESSKKGKKKSRSSSRYDDDDTRSVASAPAYDPEDGKKSKKNGFFGLFGISSNKSDSGKSRDASPKAAVSDLEEPRRKRKSKRSSMADSSELYENADAQSVVESPSADRSQLGQDDDNDERRSGRRRHRSKEEKRKSSQDGKDSFLARAGTLGAGVGLAGAAVAYAAHHLQSEATNTNSDGTDLKRGRSRAPSEVKLDDPEISHRPFRPSIDPQYGDLLPLPPSGPPSPREIPGVEDLPELPDSRPDTPESERRIAREKHSLTARKAENTPLKSPSQSAVPLRFVLNNRSTPTSPEESRSSAVGFPFGTNSDVAATPRSRNRPTSWDSTKEFKPLYLVEHNRHASAGGQIALDEPTSTTKQVENEDSPSDSAAANTNDVLSSGDQKDAQSRQTGMSSKNPNAVEEPSPVEAMSKNRSSYLLQDTPPSKYNPRSTDEGSPTPKDKRDELIEITDARDKALDALVGSQHDDFDTNAALPKQIPGEIDPQNQSSAITSEQAILAEQSNAGPTGPEFTSEDASSVSKKGKKNKKKNRASVVGSTTPIESTTTDFDSQPAIDKNTDVNMEADSSAAPPSNLIVEQPTAVQEEPPQPSSKSKKAKKKQKKAAASLEPEDDISSSPQAESDQNGPAKGLTELTDLPVDDPSSKNPSNDLNNEQASGLETEVQASLADPSPNSENQAEVGPDGLAAGYKEDQLALARQLQEDFGSGSTKKSKKGKKKAQSGSQTPDVSTPLREETSYFDDSQERGRGIEDPKLADDSKPSDALDSGYKNEQLELARQLQAEFGSDGKKSKKDKKKNRSTSRPANDELTSDNVGQEPQIEQSTDTPSTDPAPSEEASKLDGLYAGYKDDQLQIARELQASFGSGSKKKKDKKRQSAPQTPTQEPSTPILGESQPALDSKEGVVDSALTTPLPTDTPSGDGLASGYNEEQLALAKQLKEEFEGKSKLSKKDKKRQSLLRSSTVDDSNSVSLDEAAQNNSPLLQPAEPLSVPESSKDVGLEEEGFATSKKSKNKKKRQSQLQSEAAAEPIIDKTANPEPDASLDAAIVEPMTEISSSKKSKKDKKKRQSQLQSEAILGTQDNTQDDPVAAPVDSFSTEREIATDPVIADSTKEITSEEFKTDEGTPQSQQDEVSINQSTDQSVEKTTEQSQIPDINGTEMKGSSAELSLPAENSTTEQPLDPVVADPAEEFSPITKKSKKDKKKRKSQLQSPVGETSLPAANGATAQSLESTSNVMSEDLAPKDLELQKLEDDLNSKSTHEPSDIVVNNAAIELLEDDLSSKTPLAQDALPLDTGTGDTNDKNDETKAIEGSSGAMDMSAKDPRSLAEGHMTMDEKKDSEIQKLEDDLNLDIGKSKQDDQQSTTVPNDGVDLSVTAAGQSAPQDDSLPMVSEPLQEDSKLNDQDAGSTSKSKKAKKKDKKKGKASQIQESNFEETLPSSIEPDQQGTMTPKGFGDGNAERNLSSTPKELEISEENGMGKSVEEPLQDTSLPVASEPKELNSADINPAEIPSLPSEPQIQDTLPVSDSLPSTEQAVLEEAVASTSKKSKKDKKKKRSQDLDRELAAITSGEGGASVTPIDHQNDSLPVTEPSLPTSSSGDLEKASEQDHGENVVPESSQLESISQPEPSSVPESSSLPESSSVPESSSQPQSASQPEYSSIPESNPQPELTSIPGSSAQADPTSQLDPITVVSNAPAEPTQALNTEGDQLDQITSTPIGNAESLNEDLTPQSVNPEEEFTSTSKAKKGKKKKKGLDIIGESDTTGLSAPAETTPDVVQNQESMDTIPAVEPLEDETFATPGKKSKKDKKKKRASVAFENIDSETATGSSTPTDLKQEEQIPAEDTAPLEPIADPAKLISPPADDDSGFSTTKKSKKDKKKKRASIALDSQVDDAPSSSLPLEMTSEPNQIEGAQPLAHSTDDQEKQPFVQSPIENSSLPTGMVVENVDPSPSAAIDTNPSTSQVDSRDLDIVASQPIEQPSEIVTSQPNVEPLDSGSSTPITVKKSKKDKKKKRASAVLDSQENDSGTGTSTPAEPLDEHEGHQIQQGEEAQKEGSTPDPVGQSTEASNLESTLDQPISEPQKDDLPIDKPMNESSIEEVQNPPVEELPKDVSIPVSTEKDTEASNVTSTPDLSNLESQIEDLQVPGPANESSNLEPSPNPPVEELANENVTNQVEPSKLDVLLSESAEQPVGQEPSKLDNLLSQLPEESESSNLPDSTAPSKLDNLLSESTKDSSNEDLQNPETTSEVNKSDDALNQTHVEPASDFISTGKKSKKDKKKRKSGLNQQSDADNIGISTPVEQEPSNLEDIQSQPVAELPKDLSQNSGDNQLQDSSSQPGIVPVEDDFASFTTSKKSKKDKKKRKSGLNQQDDGDNTGTSTPMEQDSGNLENIESQPVAELPKDLPLNSADTPIVQDSSSQPTIAPADDEFSSPTSTKKSKKDKKKRKSGLNQLDDASPSEPSTPAELDTNLQGTSLPSEPVEQSVGNEFLEEKLPSSEPFEQISDNVLEKVQSTPHEMVEHSIDSLTQPELMPDQQITEIVDTKEDEPSFTTGKKSKKDKKKRKSILGQQDSLESSGTTTPLGAAPETPLSKELEPSISAEIPNEPSISLEKNAPSQPVEQHTTERPLSEEVFQSASAELPNENVVPEENSPSQPQVENDDFEPSTSKKSKKDKKKRKSGLGQQESADNTGTSTPIEQTIEPSLPEKVLPSTSAGLTTETILPEEDISPQPGFEGDNFEPSTSKKSKKDKKKRKSGLGQQESADNTGTSTPIEQDFDAKVQGDTPASHTSDPAVPLEEDVGFSTGKKSKKDKKKKKAALDMSNDGEIPSSPTTQTLEPEPDVASRQPPIESQNEDLVVNGGENFVDMKDETAVLEPGNDTTTTDSQTQSDLPIASDSQVTLVQSSTVATEPLTTTESTVPTNPDQSLSSQTTIEPKVPSSEKNLETEVKDNTSGTDPAEPVTTTIADEISSPKLTAEPLPEPSTSQTNLVPEVKDPAEDEWAPTPSKKSKKDKKKRKGAISDSGTATPVDPTTPVLENEQSKEISLDTTDPGAGDPKDDFGLSAGKKSKKDKKKQKPSDDVSGDPEPSGTQLPVVEADSKLDQINPGDSKPSVADDVGLSSTEKAATIPILAEAGQPVEEEWGVTSGKRSKKDKKKGKVNKIFDETSGSGTSTPVISEDQVQIPVEKDLPIEALPQQQTEQSIQPEDEWGAPKSKKSKKDKKRKGLNSQDQTDPTTTAASEPALGGEMASEIPPPIDSSLVPDTSITPEGGLPQNRSLEEGHPATKDLEDGGLAMNEKSEVDKPDQKEHDLEKTRNLDVGILEESQPVPLESTTTIDRVPMDLQDDTIPAQPQVESEQPISQDVPLEQSPVAIPAIENSSSSNVTRDLEALAPPTSEYVTLPTDQPSLEKTEDAIVSTGKLSKNDKKKRKSLLSAGPSTVDDLTSTPETSSPALGETSPPANLSISTGTSENAKESPDSNSEFSNLGKKASKKSKKRGKSEVDLAAAKVVSDELAASSHEPIQEETPSPMLEDVNAPPLKRGHFEVDADPDLATPDAEGVNPLLRAKFHGEKLEGIPESTTSSNDQLDGASDKLSNAAKLGAGTGLGVVAGLAAKFQEPGAETKKSKKGKKKIVDRRSNKEEDLFDDPALWEGAERTAHVEPTSVTEVAADDGFWTAPAEASSREIVVEDSPPMPQNPTASPEENGKEQPFKPQADQASELGELKVRKTRDRNKKVEKAQTQDPFKTESVSNLSPVTEESSQKVRSGSKDRQIPALDPNRDSTLVDESPVPPQRGFEHQYVRDSGVQLRDWSPSTTERKPEAVSDQAIKRLSWPRVSDDSETIDLARPSEPSIKAELDKHIDDIALGVAAATASRKSSPIRELHHVREHLRRTPSPRSLGILEQPHRAHSPKSLGTIPRLHTPEQSRAPSAASVRSIGSNFSSATPPLRRSNRQKSGDLRSLSQRSEASSVKQAELSDPIEINKAQAQTPGGQVHVKDMADVYDGYGEGRIGSPISPTRPPSMRRRQSMKVLDLEAQLHQLAEENRMLSEGKTQAEQSLYTAQRAVSTLADRDAEIDSLKQTIDWLHREVSRLTEVNEGLTSANVTMGNQHNERYNILEIQHNQTSKELEDLRQGGMDGVEYQNTLEEKNREIAQLYAELEAAKEQIRVLQKQILAAKASDSEFLTVRDEDYFDNACQKLCGYVQQWVLRFSKFSDMRACRLTSEISSEKIVNRLDNAVLDGSEVDQYLADRVKRRDIFMSMTMMMVWEFVFTRYLFGMDREQRQKLKSLEKLLAEVGPQSAVHQWRATTLTLLAKRQAFLKQREQDTEAVVQEIFNTLSEILPPPSQLEDQIQEQLRKVMKAAVDLSIDMRTQRAEYMMLPPLLPEYDANGDLAHKFPFNSALMNERSGDTTSNEELEKQGAVVRVVLFPLVVKKGDDRGEGDEEIVVCPAQVLVAKEHKRRSSGRVASGGHSHSGIMGGANASRLSMQSSMPGQSVVSRDGSPF